MPDERSVPELPRLRHWVGGEPSVPQLSLGVGIDDSSTAEVLDEQRASEPSAIECALAAAESAHADGRWWRLGAERRAELLFEVADRIDAHGDRLAQLDSLTCGVPITVQRSYVSLAAILFRESARTACSLPLERRFQGPGATTTVRTQPWGPALLISPWNSPLALACQKVAAALAAGCPVIVKPSEWTPHSCQLLADLVAEVGLPQGVFQLVHGGGAVGSRLASDPRVASLSFTGGLEGGRAVAAASARHLRPVQLELGGNSAMVVCDDVDMATVADHLAHGMTHLNGQWCRAVGRVLVSRRRHDELLESVDQVLATKRVGDALDARTTMGPLAHARQRATFRAAIAALCERGGRAITPCALPDARGHFESPTLVTGVSAEHARDEIFGPVATVHPVDDDAQAIELANATDYGLTHYVFSGDEERARAIAGKLVAGVIKVNAVKAQKVSRQAPRPVWKLSGLGEEGAEENVRFFMGRTGIVTSDRSRG